MNADDFGLTRGIDADILALIDAEAIDGVSLMMTGDDVAFAVAAARRRPALDVGLHLDLIEGRACGPAAEIPELVTANGRFRRGFPGLWLATSLPGPRARRLRRQLAREIGAQIRAFRTALPEQGSLRLDGHLHVHMLPAVLAAVLADPACPEIRSVRVPLERARWPASLSANGLKQLVLAGLGWRARRRLARAGLPSPPRFVGLAYSGRMHRLPLAEVLREARAAARPVELAYHPGRAHPSELAGLRFPAFHGAPARTAERDALVTMGPRPGPRCDPAATGGVRSP